jgi:NifU-like protein
LICKCFAVDEVKIIKAVKENGLTSIADVINYTKAGGGCGACHEKIEQALQKVLATQPCNEARIATTSLERSKVAPHVDLAKKDENWRTVAAVLREMHNERDYRIHGDESWKELQLPFAVLYLP